MTQAKRLIGASKTRISHRLRWFWIFSKRGVHRTRRGIQRNPAWAWPTITGTLGMVLLIILLLMQAVAAVGGKTELPFDDDEAPFTQTPDTIADDDVFDAPARFSPKPDFVPFSPDDSEIADEEPEHQQHRQPETLPDFKWEAEPARAEEKPNSFETEPDAPFDLFDRPEMPSLAPQPDPEPPLDAAEPPFETLFPEPIRHEEPAPRQQPDFDRFDFEDSPQMPAEPVFDEPEPSSLMPERSLPRPEFEPDEFDLDTFPPLPVAPPQDEFKPASPDFDEWPDRPATFDELEPKLPVPTVPLVPDAFDAPEADEPTVEEQPADDEFSVETIHVPVASALVDDTADLDSADQFTVYSEIIPNEPDFVLADVVDRWRQFTETSLPSVIEPTAYEGAALPDRPLEFPGLDPNAAEPDSSVPIASNMLDVVVARQTPEHWGVQQTSSYSLLVRNRSQSVVEEVVIADQIPASCKVVDVTPAATLEEETLRWQLTDLQPGEERTLTVEVFPTTPGTVESVASIRSTASVSSRTLIREDKAPKSTQPQPTQSKRVAPTSPQPTIRTLPAAPRPYPSPCRIEWYGYEYRPLSYYPPPGYAF